MASKHGDETPQVPRQFTFSTLTGSFVLGPDSAEEIAEICRTGGYAGIEACVPLVAGADRDQRARLATVFKDQSLEIRSFHLPFTDRIANDIASLYECERLAAVECMRRWIDIALSTGASVGIIHPTTRKDIDLAVEGFNRIWDPLRRSLRTLGAHCSERGFQLAVENLPGHGVERLGSRPEHFERMRDELPDDSIGFCLDTGHALLCEPHNPLAFMDAMGSRLIAFHLADNAGDRDSHLAPGHGRFPWRTLAEKLSHSGFIGPLCIETPPFAPGPPYATPDWTAMLEQARSLLGVTPGVG